MGGVKINLIIYYPPRSLLLFPPLILSTLPLLLSLVFVLFGCCVFGGGERFVDVVAIVAIIAIVDRRHPSLLSTLSPLSLARLKNATQRVPPCPITATIEC
jgi:hypothetical protein